MVRKVISLASALTLVALPTAASACDLDGMPGFHRYNPFAQMPGFRGLAPPPAPTQSAERRKPPQQAESQDEAGKPKPRKQQASKTPPREWERDTGNGPISAEDLATFR
ncbi:hypothetical protein [Qipengyuania sp. DGS5-3]|uniref:hypothetical protein n=1 Tax=Qipengyuania sp. DGS5-3 TaxID=3349632 RepID=UPI0036D3E6EF